ncbi:MAG: c-type cytochrome domain-containing protein, partial [Opitutaceae bacterium]
MISPRRDATLHPFMRPLSRHPTLPRLVFLAAGLAATATGAVDFNREVRPILSDKCFHCHGPDESTRKAKLRLDTREGALRLRDGTATIVPGKAAESELLQRIVSPHDDEVMPPPESKLGRLSAE